MRLSKKFINFHSNDGRYQPRSTTNSYQTSTNGPRLRLRCRKLPFNQKVQAVLAKLKLQFEQMSSQILSKMDDMAMRMDQLENNFQGLLDESNNDQITDDNEEN